MSFRRDYSKVICLRMNGTDNSPGLSGPLAPSIRRPLSPASGWALTLLSWLIPGAGFMAVRQTARGLALFALIETPFILGVLMYGSVPLPAWTPGDLGFNIVNSLTFLTQMGNGLLSGVWLAGNVANIPFFRGDEPQALADLASFYIMVSGALNYFSVCSFHDRLVAPRPKEGA